MPEAAVLNKLLEVGGIAALSLGILYLLYNSVFAKVGVLGTRQSFLVIRMILVLVFLTVLTVIAFLFLSREKSHSWSPSFDCRLARGSVEKMICDDEQLSALDYVNAVLFNNAKVAYSGAELASFIGAKNVWVAERNACAAKGCVQQKFEQRIEFLKSIQPK